MTWTTPKTWAVGDPGTAADLNTYIRDNSSFLFGDTAWTAPTLVNSWANAGGSAAPAGYRKVGNLVLLKGAINAGASNTLAFTLPAGYNPTGTLSFPINAYNSGTNANVGGFVSVGSSGSVTIVYGAGTTEIFLDSVRFLSV